MEVVENLGTLNVLIPDIFNPFLMYMSIAFAEDDLYFVFPGLRINDVYFANSRSWFLGAYNAGGEIFSSEPYKDTFTKEWLISISKAIYYQDGSFRAVVGIDYFLKFFYESINDVKILSSGFACIVSHSGLVVSDVPIWENEDYDVRIYEPEKTGLNKE